MFWRAITGYSPKEGPHAGGWTHRRRGDRRGGNVAGAFLFALCCVLTALGIVLAMCQAQRD